MDEIVKKLLALLNARNSGFERSERLDDVNGVVIPTTTDDGEDLFLTVELA